MGGGGGGVNELRAHRISNVSSHKIVSCLAVPPGYVLTHASHHKPVDQHRVIDRV